MWRALKPTVGSTLDSLRQFVFRFVCVIALIVAVSAHHAAAEVTLKLQTLSYDVVATYPHDSHAFTQGLLFADGFLYESTGRRGQSTLRRVELESGNVSRMHRLNRQYFAEGLALYNDKLIQLTWQSRKGFIYDKTTFAPRGEFTYRTEGWGLTYDGTHLIMSDGSAFLRKLDPIGLRETGRMRVTAEGEPVTRLNELEYVAGRIYANVWGTDKIAIIDPATGKVQAWLDLSGLLSAKEARDADVLNGIAYDANEKRLFVTGKLWPKLFEIKLKP